MLYDIYQVTIFLILNYLWFLQKYYVLNTKHTGHDYRCLLLPDLITL